MKKLLAAAFIAVTALLIAVPESQAGVRVRIGLPAVSIGYPACYPAYYPQPVYYGQPYYAPAPVVYGPPVYYAPRPRRYYSGGRVVYRGR